MALGPLALLSESRQSYVPVETLTAYGHTYYRVLSRQEIKTLDLAS